MMNLKNGGLTTSAMDSIVLQNQKHDMSLNQVRMLTQSEIELLQKDKKESVAKAFEILNKMKIGEKQIAATSL